MSQYWGTSRIGATQNAAYTATAGTVANAVKSGTQKVRVMVTTDAFIAIGTSPTATTSDVYLPALKPEYFTISAGEKVSAVQAAAGGTLYIMEAV